jgi:hypothetical protein
VVSRRMDGQGQVVGGAASVVSAREAPKSELFDHLYWTAHKNMGLDDARRSDMAGAVEALGAISLASAK